VADADLPEAALPLAAALAVLRETLVGRRTLVVAAADLAHVGPAFGDAEPLAAAEKAALAAADAALLERVAAGDATGFLGLLRAQGDRWRVCGLPPTYWALRLLEQVHGSAVPGRLAGYDQCPADETGGSVVSIAGMLWEPDD
jgi:AmmeMemoRadiSam system protein B